MVLLFLSFIPALSFGCKGSENKPKQSFENVFKNASLVFIGTMVNVEYTTGGTDAIATFQITRSWKGPKEGTFTFPLETSRSCDLGKYADKSSTWFIVAKKTNERILTASYSRRLFDVTEERDQIAIVQKIK